MPTWKKIIFVNAIETRMAQESKTANLIIQEYVKLTAEEKVEILATINS